MGMEISFDLLEPVEERGGWEEGTFRLVGGEWQVFVVAQNEGEGEREVIRKCVWPSRVAGLYANLSIERGRLERRVVVEVLMEAYGAERWVEVCGPNSLELR